MIQDATRLSVRRKGFSLLEIMVALSIVALMATLASQEYFGAMRNAKGNACGLQKNQIDIQVRRWKRAKGRWPRTDLRDVGRDTRYFSQGLPRCPVTDKAYRLNPRTHRVAGHNH